MKIGRSILFNMINVLYRVAKPRKRIIQLDGITSIVVYLKGGIGDFFLLLPTLKAIKENSKINIQLFVPRRIKEIASRYNYFHSIVEIKRNKDNLLERVQSFIHEFKLLYTFNFQLLYIPPIGSNLVISLIGLFIRKKKIVGFNNSECIHQYDYLLEFSSTTVVSQNAKFLSILGIQVPITIEDLPSHMFKYNYNDSVMSEILFNDKKNIICIYPTTSDEKKDNEVFDVRSFSILIKNMAKYNTKYLFVILGGQNDSKYCGLLKELLSPKIVCHCFANNKDIFINASLVARSKAIVGIDGGFMHVVQSLNVRKVTLWKSENYLLYGYESGNNLNIDIRKYANSHSLHNVKELAKVIHEFIEQ